MLLTNGLAQSCDAVAIDRIGEFSCSLSPCADDQSVRKLKVRCVCTTIARDQGSLLVLVCEPMTFLQSNGPVSHEPREALRQMPTATAPGWRGPERAEPGMSARAGEPPALLLELPLCRALQFFARARSPVSFMRMMCPQARL